MTSKPEKWVMKTLLSILLVFSTLLYLGCSTCGKHVDLGNFEVMPESKNNWFPYSDKEELIFENATGQVLPFSKTHYNEDFQQFTTKWLCENNRFDRAYEFAEFEELFAAYAVTQNNVVLSFSMHMTVGYYNYTSGSFDNNTFDRVSYNLLFKKEGAAENSAEGNITNDDLILLAHNRGNNVGDSGFDNDNFLEQLTLNGTVYHNVWYSDNDNNLPKDKDNNPIIYVQEQKGVIGFLDNNLEAWVLVD